MGNGKKLGVTDKPIENISEDQLGVGKHIKGLSNFIKVCETPMTIAIQGDWGTGKTSFMNMIKVSLGEEVKSCWFNTWQFSQFNLDESLTVVFLETLVNEITKDRPEADSDRIHKTLKCFGNIALAGVNGFIKNQTEVDLIETISPLVSAQDKSQNVASLKEDFQICVNQSLEKDQRLVVFVDDLDRLNPERAVEVLEVLKLFLDCENCVFVLAIDYDVVCRGVAKKYGEDFQKDKGKSFFDKIIQVPFKMPTAHYQIEEYIRNNLKNMNVETDDIKAYSKLIAASIGYNPRAMKRIFNAFLLLTMIFEEKELSDDYRKKMLFAVLCLQLSFEEVYNFIILDVDDAVSRELLEEIAVNEDSTADDESSKAFEFYDALEEKLSSKYTLEENEMATIKEFMVFFCQALLRNDKLTEKDFELFIAVLNIAGTTANVTNSVFAGNGKTGKGIRYANEIEASFSYHNLSETLEKSNKPSGWNGCKLQDIKLFDKVISVKSFADIMQEVITYCYDENPNKLLEIKENSEKYGLYSLFNGTKRKGIATPKKICGDIVIEGKNGNNAKIVFLRKLLVGMGYSQDELQFNIKLAKRIEKQI